MVNTAVQQETVEQYQTRQGKAWTLPFDAVDPTTSDDVFLYLKNNGDKEIVVSKIEIMSTVAGFAEVEPATGTAAGGTAITAVNKLRAAGYPPDVSAQYAVDITGLTEGGKLNFIYLPANTFTQVETHIRLRKNEAICINWTAATGVLTGVVHIYEEP